jgi:hypothetical protein
LLPFEPAPASQILQKIMERLHNATEQTRLKIKTHWRDLPTKKVFLFSLVVAHFVALTLKTQIFTTRWVCEWNEEDRTAIIAKMKEKMQTQTFTLLLSAETDPKSCKEETAEDPKMVQIKPDWGQMISLCVPELGNVPYVAKVMGEWKNVEDILGTIIDNKENEGEREWDILGSFFLSMMRRHQLNEVDDLVLHHPSLFECIWKPFRSFCVTGVIW